MEKQLCHFIIYELSDGVKTGYAIFCTKSKTPHKVAIQKANDVDWKGLECNLARSMMDPDIINTENDFSLSPYEYPFLSYGVNCDRPMIELLLDIIAQIKNGEYAPVHHLQGDDMHYGLTEHMLKFFWVSKYVDVEKRKDILDAGWQVFQEVHAGNYQDKFRYTYVVPTPTYKASWDPDLDITDDEDYDDEDDDEDEGEGEDEELTSPRPVTLTDVAEDFLTEYIPEALRFWNPDDVLTAIYNFIFEHGLISWIDGYNELGLKAQEVYADVLRSNCPADLPIFKTRQDESAQPVFGFRIEATNNFLGTDGSGSGVIIYDNGLIRYNNYLFNCKEPASRYDVRAERQIVDDIRAFLQRYAKVIAAFPDRIDNHSYDGDWFYFTFGDKTVCIDNPIHFGVRETLYIKSHQQIYDKRLPLFNNSLLDILDGIEGILARYGLSIDGPPGE